MSKFLDRAKTCIIVDGHYTALLNEIMESYLPAKVTKVSIVHAALDLLEDRLVSEKVLSDRPPHGSGPKVKPTK
jgi:hypothetical protein